MEMKNTKRDTKNRKFWIIAVAMLLIVSIIVAGVFCFDKNPNTGDNYHLFGKPTQVTTKIGISYATVGSVARKTPISKDEGLSRYPVYGQNLRKESGESDDDFGNLKSAILAENAYLNTDPNATLSGECTNYNRIDADGYLYLNDTPVIDAGGNHRQLYKHTASNGMYFGNVSDGEPAVVKQIKIQPRKMGNYITGLYAPAGEVIKLTISAVDLKSIKAFNIYVGATLANGQANNIWKERDFNRMPVIANKIPVNKDICTYDENTQTYTCYFGSYLGGPIYVGSPEVKNQFQVEVSGAVEYPHFIYGLTTKEEYNRLLKSSAPYFDMEIFDNAVRFSGPRTYSDKYSYEELCKSAELWDKISRVSKQVPTGSNSSYGIDFLFEPFIAAGAAVAFVGRNTVNCPVDWMDSCLNVENFIVNGAWGSIHEFNHHYQNYGIPDGGEVTNNAISLVEYSLFTKVSAKRSLDDNTLSDWNRFTDPSRALRELIDNPSAEVDVRQLAFYATVLHSFGQSVFINATKNGSGVDNWYKNLCNLTHYDFYYYFTEIFGLSITSSVAEEIAQMNYPMYVPVACNYQTGTMFCRDNTWQQITTVQPFEFSGESYEFDIKSVLKMPEGFTIDNITVGNPQYGNLTKIGDDLYKFTPSAEKISGDINVTIELSKNDGSFEVKDVVLVFGFKQQQKRIAERTTYYFDSDLLTIFEDLDDAVKKDFAGYTSLEKFDNKFNNKECADIWWNTEGVRLNSISEYNSKIYISENNTYRFSIRGRNANLYISLDGESYELVAQAGEKYNNNFNVSVENGEYKDYQLKRGQVVYIKAVVLHNNVNFEGSSCVIGMAVSNNDSFSLDSLTKKTTVYNINYQKESFETYYFYPREYYGSEVINRTNATSSVVSTNFEPWDSTTDIQNLFDDDLSTYMHNKKGSIVSESSPFEIVVDLGTVVDANKIIMYGRAQNTQTPKSYKLYGGTSVNEMRLLCEYDNKSLVNGCNQTGDFDLIKIRYYKLIVTKTNANYICLANIEFVLDLSNAKLLSPDVDNVNYYGEWSVDYDLSMFGHSYVAENGYLEFTFSGTMFAIYSKINKTSTFTISIDGAEEVVVNFSGATDLMFLQDGLENKTHKIIIKPTSKIDVVAFAIK